MKNWLISPFKETSYIYCNNNGRIHKGSNQTTIVGEENFYEHYFKVTAISNSKLAAKICVKKEKVGGS